MAKRQPKPAHFAAPHSGSIEDRIAWAREFNPSGVNALERERDTAASRAAHHAAVEGTTREPGGKKGKGVV